MLYPLSPKVKTPFLSGIIAGTGNSGARRRIMPLEQEKKNDNDQKTW
jgi:hypothetical protein